MRQAWGGQLGRVVWQLPDMHTASGEDAVAATPNIGGHTVTARKGGRDDHLLPCLSLEEGGGSARGRLQCWKWTIAPGNSIKTQPIYFKTVEAFNQGDSR